MLGFIPLNFCRFVIACAAIFFSGKYNGMDLVSILHLDGMIGTL